jgi:hypothetical protein
MRRAVLTKEDLESYELAGVHLGDLIYDQFLAEFKEVTLELADPRLWHIAKRAIELFHFFTPIFEKNHIVGVFGVNAYLSGVVARMALARKIPAFQTDILIERLRVPMVDGNFTQDLPMEFERSGLNRHSEVVLEAERYVQDFIQGKPVSPIFGHSFQSFLPSAEAPDQLLSKTDRLKVLIAPHNPFSDSPHAVGKALFPDYGEWLNFIGLLTESCDYDWYIKIHPDRRDPWLLEKNREWIRDFCERFARITLLPEDASHHQLIREGIGAVLTVHGSIGFEYTLRGIPVVNASINNPHRPFGFTLTPSSREELVEIVSRLDSFDYPNPPLDDVVKYCYMWLFHIYKGPLFPNLHALAESFAGRPVWDTPEIYGLLIAEWGSDRNIAVRRSLPAFFRSNDRLWLERHLTLAQ